MESRNDTTRFAASILDLNTPTINGKVYTREVIQKALEDAALI